MAARAVDGRGVPADAIEKHLAVLGNKNAMEAALAWYRARGAIRVRSARSGCHALHLGRCRRHRRAIAAEGTADFIAAPYRFEVLPASAFWADQAPDRVSALLLQHVAAFPA
jgi:hypothetical protein